MTAEKNTNKKPALRLGVTPELAERWRKMAIWEAAVEAVEKCQWNLDIAKRNLETAIAKEANIRLALGELTVLESGT